MAKERNSGKKWSDADEDKLRTLAVADTTTKEMARRFGRSESAVRAKASDLDVSLLPKDK